MNALFEEELNLEKRMKFDDKQEIALVTQLTIPQVGKVFGKFEEYRSMHKVLRNMRLNNEPLPETVKELQQLYLMNSQSRKTKKFKYMQYKEVAMD
jgi:methylthioribose-1-phosphate isomerase